MVVTQLYTSRMLVRRQTRLVCRLHCLLSSCFDRVYGVLVVNIIILIEQHTVRLNKQK